MIVVKAINNTKYILYPLQTADWAMVGGVYFVNPSYEHRFIQDINVYHRLLAIRNISSTSSVDTAPLE